MNVTRIGQKLAETTQIKRVIRSLGSPGASLSICGLLSDGGKALVLAILASATKRPIAYVSADPELESLADEVRFFHGLINDPQHQANDPRSTIVTIPAFDVGPYRGVSPHPATLDARAHALYCLNRGWVRLALISPRSLVTRTVAPTTIAQLGCEFQVGKEYPFEGLLEHLPRVGYRQEDPVTAIGEFSVRGGILDVFSSAHRHPLRLEFFGDELESMREFDVETQRSITQVERALVTPMCEIAYDPQIMRRWATLAGTRWADPLFRYDLTSKHALAEAGETFDGWEFQVPLVMPLEGTLLQYFPNGLLVLDEPSLLQTEVESFLERMRSQYEEAGEAGEVALEPETFFLTPDQLNREICSLSRIEFSSMGRTAGLLEVAPRDADLWAACFDIQPQQEVALSAVPVRRFRGHIQQAIEEIKKARAEQMAVLVVARSKGMAERLAEMLQEFDLRVDSEPDDPTLPGTDAETVKVVTGELRRGCALPWAQLYVLAESDIFQDEQLDISGARRPQGGGQFAAFLSDFRDLKPGDFVVHIDHGIGRFQGLIELETRDARQTREFLHLQYADGAKLYVPVERLDLVQKYSSADGASPTLDRLGGTGWERTKARARRALRDMAEELLKLYAERNLVEGFAFSSDSPWQLEFEAGFEYDLTPDQEAAVNEVKVDMEQRVPMDRLLCGDVGFGKTEVAMRAAFKAVMDGKQVAVLAPTTVLAYQHLQTFQRRFAAFPMRVELLSRFRSPKQQKQIIAELATGGIDIIIGTHRLLSQDIRLHDLGLVIVDEEQRFGVRHKERLKQLRRRVDVLTLSATPIPRTLSMSLMGLKPMSVIETPPRDRLAIQTVLARFSPAIIKTAIERELDREGQVFFVHNRIDSIYTVADLIRRMVPQARLGVSHAELTPRALENVMLQFVRHELDVLVSTTVIENGIDIPLANTIIINHAERFGLSELYQLRGRVGRSSRRAYAYLLIPDERALTPIARRRLAAIKEFSDLGAGFRLAAMDLELRGAGNLLGAQQTGHIRAVGFELYCQMLERAMRELKGEVIEEEVNTQIDLDVEIRIPEGYIPDVGQRLRVYKRISAAPDDERLRELEGELRDRYGPLPPAVQNLMAYASLRRQAMALRVLAISRHRQVVHLKFDAQSPVDTEKVIEFVNNSTAAGFTPDGVLKFVPEAVGTQPLLAELKNCLMRLM